MKARRQVLPQSDGSGYRVIAMNDRKDSFDKFIHVKDLLQVFLTLLGYFQDTKSQEVVPEIRQMSVSKLNVCQHMLDLKRFHSKTG